MGTSPDRKSIIQAIGAGCDDFVLKPFKFEVLLNKVEKLFDFRKRIEENEKLDYQREEQKEEIIIYSKQAMKKAFTYARKGKWLDFSFVQNIVNE